MRNTSLVEIRVSSEKPEEAARIANAIAEAYKAHRHEQRAQLSRGDQSAGGPFCGAGGEGQEGPAAGE